MRQDNIIRVTQIDDAPDDEGNDAVVAAWPQLAEAAGKGTAFASVTYIVDETVDEDDQPFTYRGLDLVLPKGYLKKEDQLLAELNTLADALLELAGTTHAMFAIERDDVSIEISDEDGYDKEELADLLE
ncbi:MAG: hypothetical protein Q8P18_30850 [Pseudomonadota bacterium]|nr:hypothetical protein [Pseudomonadota bacterium]